MAGWRNARWDSNEICDSSYRVTQLAKALGL